MLFCVSVQFVDEYVAELVINGGDLPYSDYAFLNFQIHWDVESATESGHMLDGTQMPAEVYFKTFFIVLQYQLILS